jgi:hypothetical protein
MYPHERSLVKDYKDKPFALIGVNSDKDLETLRPRMEEERITWRSFWNGPEGTSGPISAKWNVTGWPSLYLIDHEGVIRYSSVGFKQDEMDAQIEKWVAVAEAAQKGGEER